MPNFDPKVRDLILAVFIKSENGEWELCFLGTNIERVLADWENNFHDDMLEMLVHYPECMVCELEADQDFVSLRDCTLRWLRVWSVTVADNGELTLGEPRTQDDSATLTLPAVNRDLVFSLR